MDTFYSEIDFYDKLKLKYNEYLKPEIVSVSMVQSKDTVYLESIEIEELEDGLEKKTVKRIDLSFITDGDKEEKLYFNPNDPIEINVKKFVDDFGPYSIINTTEIFTDEAAEKISKRYNTFGIDK